MGVTYPCRPGVTRRCAASDKAGNAGLVSTFLELALLRERSANLAVRERRGVHVDIEGARATEDLLQERLVDVQATAGRAVRRCRERDDDRAARGTMDVRRRDIRQPSDGQ